MALVCGLPRRLAAIALCLLLVQASASRKLVRLTPRRRACSGNPNIIGPEVLPEPQLDPDANPGANPDAAPEHRRLTSQALPLSSSPYAMDGGPDPSPGPRGTGAAHLAPAASMSYGSNPGSMAYGGGMYGGSSVSGAYGYYSIGGAYGGGPHPPAYEVAMISSESHDWGVPMAPSAIVACGVEP